MVDYKEYLTIHNIVVVILAIIGLIWLISAAWRNWKISSIRSWPKTNASVINALVEPENVSSISGSNLLDHRYLVSTDNSTKYIPRVLYRYTVNGREYQSTNVVYGGEKAYNSFDIKTMMGHITPGSTVQVYVNPNDHNESYIYNGTAAYMGILMGLVLLAIAAAIGYHHNVNQKRGSGNIYVTKNEYDIRTPTLTDMAPRVVNKNAAAANKFWNEFY